MQNRNPLNSSEPKKTSRDTAYTSNTISCNALKNANRITRKANTPSAPTTFAIRAARLSALPRRPKISHMRKASV